VLRVTTMLRMSYLRLQFTCLFCFIDFTIYIYRELMDTSTSEGGGTRITAQTSEQLLKTLECPVCMEIVIPPVFNCGNGHIICGLCHPRVPKCGLCASNFTTARNYTVESILALIDTTCRNSLCSKALRADKLRDHLDTCEYR